MQLPARAARQLPDQSITWNRPPLMIRTLQGAMPIRTMRRSDKNGQEKIHKNSLFLALNRLKRPFEFGSFV
jgi:hypothetical protein